jgi:predicted transposase YdaD
VPPPHDHLFQLVFAAPEHAVPLLRSALPAPVAAAIDWSTLARRNPAQRARRTRIVCDLLFSVRLVGGRELLLYVVLEHKSKSTRFDALQMLEQVTAVLRGHRRSHPADAFLPPVLPLVVHADQRSWQSPLQVRELFDLHRIPAALHRFLPSLEFALDDLHGASPERLRNRALSVFGLCALSALQYLPPAANNEQAFAAWVDAWCDVQDAAARLADAAPGEELFAAVIDYVQATTPLPLAIVQRVLQRRIPSSHMTKKFVSLAQQLRNEGRSEGRSEGRTEGRTEGRAEGQANTLLRQITRRFGPPTDAIATRIRAASLDDLDRWTDRILDAPTLADVFAD